MNTVTDKTPVTGGTTRRGKKNAPYVVLIGPASAPNNAKAHHATSFYNAATGHGAGNGTGGNAKNQSEAHFKREVASELVRKLQNVVGINVEVGYDGDGEKESVVVMHGKHFICLSCETQALVSYSSGERAYYGIVRAVIEG